MIRVHLLTQWVKYFSEEENEWCNVPQFVLDHPNANWSDVTGTDASIIPPPINGVVLLARLKDEQSALVDEYELDANLVVLSVEPEMPGDGKKDKKNKLVEKEAKAVEKYMQKCGIKDYSLALDDREQCINSLQETLKSQHA